MVESFPIDTSESLPTVAACSVPSPKTVVIFPNPNLSKVGKSTP